MRAQFIKAGPICLQLPLRLLAKPVNQILQVAHVVACLPANANTSEQAQIPVSLDRAIGALWAARLRQPKPFRCLFWSQQG